jgi:hypothetical protein
MVYKGDVIGPLVTTNTAARMLRANEIVTATMPTW